MEFFKSALPKVHAFVSPYEAGEVLTQYPNYSNEVKAIVHKLGAASKEITPCSQLVLELIPYLHDDEKCKQVFGFGLNAKPNSFHLNFEVFESSLNFIFKHSLSEQLQTKPLEYLEALSDIKTDITTSIFIEVKLGNLFQYLCLFEIIMKKMTNSGSSKLYFIRGFVFFIVNIIVADHSSYRLKKAALSAFNYYFDTILNLGTDIFKDYLSDLARSFVSLVESVKESDIRASCLGVLKRLICDNHLHFEESIEKLDSFPNTPDYDDLRQIHNKYHRQHCSDGLRGDIENFLRDFNRGADGLRSFKNSVRSFFFISLLFNTF